MTIDKQLSGNVDNRFITKKIFIQSIGIEHCNYLNQLFFLGKIWGWDKESNNKNPTHT